MLRDSQLWGIHRIVCVSNVCANVKMGTVIVGYGIAVYGRLRFTNDILVSLMYLAAAYF